MAAPRTRTLPRATTVDWEAERPPVIDLVPAQRSSSDPEVLPVAAPYGTGPVATAGAPEAGLAGRFAAGTAAAVLTLLVALTLIGGLLELTGAVPR